jgi:hypothetical protein
LRRAECAEAQSDKQQEIAEMVVPKILLAVVVLNLIFLALDLVMNVVRVYFG